MLADPFADIRWINTPHLLRVEVGGSPMESKIRVGHDANVVAWNIANEDRACGYARAHNSNPYPACGKGGPLRLICAEKAALEVRDIDRFRACGRCGERQNCNQQKLPGSHRPAPFSWTAHSTGRAVRACAKLRHRRRKSIQVAPRDDQVTARTVIEEDVRA